MGDAIAHGARLTPTACPWPLSWAGLWRDAAWAVDRLQLQLPSSIGSRDGLSPHLSNHPSPGELHPSLQRDQIQSLPEGFCWKFIAEKLVFEGCGFSGG